MPIVDLLKRFIRGEEKKIATKFIPSIVKLETNVNEYWSLKGVIGDGAFGSVYKAINRANNNLIAAAKVEFLFFGFLNWEILHRFEKNFLYFVSRIEFFHFKSVKVLTK